VNDNAAADADPNPRALIVYDGECIFCQNYVRMIKLRESVGTVDLVDARSDDPRARAIVAQGFDLDEGMVFSYRDRIYHGSDAVHAIALLGSSSSAFNRLNAMLFSRPTIARLSYPWLKAGRRATLWLRGRKLIRQSGVTDGSIS
jgi:predicted DCC family thiol-disulfide oxidoreductase YuxK